MSTMIYPTSLRSLTTRPALATADSVERMLRFAARWERPAWIVATVASSFWALYGLTSHLL
jgi:hypothetical protein